MDISLRELERAALAGDLTARTQFINALFRLGHHPYWFRIREDTCNKDNIYHDETLRERDPTLPRWEDRGPSNDRDWTVYLHIPMSDGTEVAVWLGEIICEEQAGVFACSIRGAGNLYTWDQWAERAITAGNREEELRANWALVSNLKSASHTTNQVLLTSNPPLTWTPDQPLPLSYEERPLPPILVEDYLFERFEAWLRHSSMEYVGRLRDASSPLDYQLPTIYQGRHIWLHYWVVYEGKREIFAEKKDPYGDRVAYDVAYCVSWCHDYSARFARWSHDPGWADGTPENRLSTCKVVRMDQPEAAHIVGQATARDSAKQALDEKLEGLIKAATRWRYEVILEQVSLPYQRSQVHGCPCHSNLPLPYEYTWKAGMVAPQEIFDKNKNFWKPI